MTAVDFLGRNLRETLALYWPLVRIIVPVAVLTQALIEAGAVAALSPWLEPVMALYGLPAGLALAWLTGMLVGIWAAVVVVFSVVPVAALTEADMTVFAALILFAHGLPIEQSIIRKAGPRLVFTTALRLFGGMIFAGATHLVLMATGWLSASLDPLWIPMGGGAGWGAFFAGLGETLVWMLVILAGLAMLLDALRLSGLMTRLNRGLAPVFGLAGIHGPARELTAIGMILGVSYGGGLLIREARSGGIAPRQIVLACVFMGFAHAIIEDTLVMLALGADFKTIFVARLVFSIAATALVARALRSLPDAAFDRFIFRAPSAPGEAG